MIFNDDLIFIHIGKTGGMSCANYLLKNLKRPVYSCHEFADKEITKLAIDGVTPRTDTKRHWTLEQSLQYIKEFNGKELSDFTKVMAVVRHPYSLEYSFCNHMKKPHIQKQRGDVSQSLFDLANTSFKDFVKYAGYHAPGLTQDAFIRVNGKIPESVELIKFEALDPAFADAVEPFIGAGDGERIASVNKTQYSKDLSDVLTGEVKDLIYLKHRYMFDSGLYSEDL